MSTTPLDLAALGASLAAVTLGVATLRRQGSPRPSRQTEKPLPYKAISGVARRYDESRAGRRLAAALWSAQLDLTPAGWRCAQLFVTFPATTFLVAVGVPGLPAAMLALSLSRLGGRALLWLRRHAARNALDDAAPLIARALAVELSGWGSGMQAIAAAARRCRSTPVAAQTLELAAARVALGAEPAVSLQRALDQAEPRLTDSSPMRNVAAVFALHRFDAGATAVALDRLAHALEDDRAVRREARAAVGEVRMSAVAVPLIALATGVMVVSADPPALAAALSWPLFPMLLGATGVVSVAAAIARRLVAI